MAETFDETRLQQLIDLLVSMLAAAGVPPQSTVSAVERAYETYVHKNPPAESNESENLTRADKLLMGNLLSLWGQLPAYCDELGESLPLPLRGPAPSLEALLDLAIRRTPASAEPPSVEEVERRFMLRKVMAKNEDGRYRRLIDWFPSSSRKEILVPMLLDYVIDYLHNANYNAVHGGGGGLFQRVAQVDAFPLDRLPAINRLVHDQGMPFLRLIDEEMMKEVEKAASAPDAKLGNVGVGVYFFVRDMTV